MLPALKHGVRCEAEWCDELTFFLVWGTVVGGLTGLSLGTTVVGIRRFLHLRRARYLPTVSLCELTPQHVGRLIEVQGRVVSDSPLVGLLSQREVIGYELEIKSTRRKPGLLRRKTSTVSTTFRFFTDASLNDGTGSVHLELENALLYWPHVRATWAPEEAPDWALPAKSLHSEEDRLVRVAATERYVPHGATVFVLGNSEIRRLWSPEFSVWGPSGLLSEHFLSKGSPSSQWRYSPSCSLSGWVTTPSALRCSIWRS